MPTFLAPTQLEYKVRHPQVGAKYFLDFSLQYLLSFWTAEQSLLPLETVGPQARRQRSDPDAE